MCIALPATLLPQQLLYRFGLISKIQEEKLALFTGQFCARWLFRLIPFCKVECNPYHDDNPQPAIWVCNHSSALDIFLLLANDLKLRGKKKRPIKIVYASFDTAMAAAVFVCLVIVELCPICTRILTCSLFVFLTHKKQT